MTKDVLTKTPAYTISGVGPYTIEDPYKAAEDIISDVLVDGKRVRLTSAERTISPESSTSKGAVTLSAAAALTYAGAKLYIRRNTEVEQGWSAQTERERGLETQLDNMTMGLQDALAELGKTLRTEGAPEKLYIEIPAGMIVIGGTEDGPALVPGPNVSELASVAKNAQIALAAAAAAEAAAESVNIIPVFRKRYHYTKDLLTNPLELKLLPVLPTLVDLEINTQAMIYGKDFTVSDRNLNVNGGWPPDVEDVQITIWGGAEILDGEGAGDLVADRDDLVEWNTIFGESQPIGKVLWVDGVGWQYDPTVGLALPGLNNWKPFGDALSTRHLGSDSELSSDFVGRLRDAIDWAGARKLAVALDPKRDGTPYEYSGGIDHTLLDDCRMIFHPNAVLRPNPNFQHFTTGGAVGPFEITDFIHDPDTDLPLSGMLVEADGTETKFVKDTNFTVEKSPLRVTLSVAPPAGSFFVACTSIYALRLRSTSGNGRRFDGSGRLTIDGSNLGYAIASGSGSGFGLTNIDTWTMDGEIYGYTGSNTGYGAGPLDKRGDSLFVPLGFLSGVFNRLRGVGWSDLVLYGSGNSSNDLSDDAKGLIGNLIISDRCNTVGKYERQGRRGIIHAIQMINSRCAWIRGETGAVLTGSTMHIGSIMAERTGDRLIDIRECPQGGFYVGSIHSEDIGRFPDGATETETPIGVRMNECAGLTVGHLHMRQKEWTSTTDVVGIRAYGDDNYGNVVRSGYIEGYDVGIEETGGTTNDVGNRYTLTMKDVATPLALATGSDTEYRITLLNESGGTITKTRLNSEIGEYITGYVPEYFFPAPAGTVTLSVQLSTLYYRNVGPAIEASVRARTTITHTETGKELRIQLPFTVIDPNGSTVPLVVGRANGLSLPADYKRVYAEVASGTDYIRLRYITSAGASANVTSDHVPTGTQIWIECSGLLPVAG